MQEAVNDTGAWRSELRRNLGEGRDNPKTPLDAIVSSLTA